MKKLQTATSPDYSKATGRSRDPNACLPVPKPSDFISELLCLPTWRSSFTENTISEKQKKDLLTESIPQSAIYDA